MKRFLTTAAALMVIMPVISGCAGKVTDPNGFGTLKIRLTDAPGDFDAVNITFSEISAHIDGSWISIPVEPKTVNLLEWTDGKSIEIGSGEVPAGHYTQIRVSIETAEVVMDGSAIRMTVPSSAQTGLKLITNFTIEAESTHQLTIDFDAERSVVIASPPDEPVQYILQPTIRVLEMSSSELED